MKCVCSEKMVDGKLVQSTACYPDYDKPGKVTIFWKRVPPSHNKNLQKIEQERQEVSLLGGKWPAILTECAD